MITNERLTAIRDWDQPQYSTGVHVTRAEEVEMATELLALRDRNHRLTVAALNGNSRAVYREFAKTYLPKDANGESHLP